MKKYFIACIICLSFFSCEREIDKYYKTPDWLKGNAYEVMKDQGNFSMFMKAVEKSSYATLVKGKGIVTVMAPTDDAFQNYLNKHGYNDIDQLNNIELDKLVGFHLIYYSYNKNNFLFYNPNGVDATLEYPGFYFKFRTKSRDAISTAIDYANGGATRKIMQKERFIPILSNYSLATINATAKSEYERLYPESKFTEDVNGFNVANACVIGDEIITDNGYLYIIDQVLEPLETIYTELSQPNSGYSQFLSLYNRFVNYEYDADATADYGNGDSLFVRSHINLPPIACEWTNTISSSVPDYAQTADLSSISYCVLAPSDALINQFYQTYWANSFSSIDEVNYIPLRYFMNNHVIRFIGKNLTLEYVENYLKSIDIYDDKVGQIDRVKTCSNGIIGGMDDNVITPEYFMTPISPALCKKDYNMFAFITDKAEIISKFSSKYESRFDVFFPNDDMLKRSEYNGDFIQYMKGNSYIINDEKVLVANSSDGTMSNISRSQAQDIGGAHISDGIMSQKGNNEVIYSTYNDFEYLYLKDDKIYSSYTWNYEALGNSIPVPSIQLIKDYGTKGCAYELIGDAGTAALLPDQGNFKDRVTQDRTFYNGFNLYLNMTSVSKTEPTFSFLQGNRFIVFVPTQDAILYDISNTRYFPIAGSMDMKDNYMKSLFVDVSANGLLDYPFGVIGHNSEQQLLTFGTNNDGEKVTITLINDEYGNLKLKDSKGNIANVTSYFPYIYADGAAYLIDGILDLLN